MKCSLCVGCHIGHDPHRLLSSLYKSSSPGKQSHWVSHGRGASLGFPWDWLVPAPGSTVGSLPNSSDLMSVTWKVGVFTPQKLAMSTNRALAGVLHNCGRSWGNDGLEEGAGGWGVTYWKHWWTRQVLSKNPEAKCVQLWKVKGEALRGDHGRTCVRVTAAAMDLLPRSRGWATVAEDSWPLGRRRQVWDGAEGSENRLGPTWPCWISITEGDLQSCPSPPLCFTPTS